MDMGHCQYCHEQIPTGKFIALNGGALLQYHNDPDTAMPSESLSEFLSVTCHDWNGDGDEVYKEHDIIPFNGGLGIGQFEVYFCSKECCRNWFNMQLEQIPDIRT